jgi:hypothetical protein
VDFREWYQRRARVDRPRRRFCSLTGAVKQSAGHQMIAQKTKPSQRDNRRRFARWPLWASIWASLAAAVCFPLLRVLDTNSNNDEDEDEDAAEAENASSARRCLRCSRERGEPRWSSALAGHPRRLVAVFCRLKSSAPRSINSLMRLQSALHTTMGHGATLALSRISHRDIDFARIASAESSSMRFRGSSGSYAWPSCGARNSARGDFHSISENFHN